MLRMYFLGADAYAFVQHARRAIWPARRRTRPVLQLGGLAMYQRSQLFALAIIVCALLLAPAASGAQVVIPAGTLIEVQLSSGIDSSKAVVGEIFPATIADPVVVGTEIVIPRGTNAEVELVRTAEGQFGVTLNNFTLNGTKYQVASEFAALPEEARGGRAARRGALGAGAGALIGGLAGGGSGAAIGAGVGAGAGAGSVLIRGRKVQIPPETRLSFQLRSPVEVRT